MNVRKNIVLFSVCLGAALQFLCVIVWQRIHINQLELTCSFPEREFTLGKEDEDEDVVDVKGGVADGDTDETTNDIRLLCFILTDPALGRQTRAARDTWARRCDVTLFMSSDADDDMPTIGLDVLPGRHHIAEKIRQSWVHVYQNYFDEADYFIKADPDTYVVVDNLKRYLSGRDACAAEYFGHRFQLITDDTGTGYMSGGPGYVLSREALRMLVVEAFTQQPSCIHDGEGEDFQISFCLNRVGVKHVDTLDAEGKETFIALNPKTLLNKENIPEWYRKYDVHGALQGIDCCSSRPISFHYINPEEMLLLDYLIYSVFFPRETNKKLFFQQD